MPELPLLVTAKVRGLGELQELSRALSRIAGSSRVTRSSLQQLQEPFRQAVASAAPIRATTRLAQQGLEALGGAAADASGKIRAVPPEVNRLLSAINAMASGAKISTATLQKYAQAAIEASAPFKRLQAVMGHFASSLDVQQSVRGLQEVLRQMNATVGISNSQLLGLIHPLQVAIQTFAPLMTEVEASKVGFTQLANATSTFQGRLVAVPPAVNTLIALITKMAGGTEVNIAKLLAAAAAAEQATASYKPLNSVLNMVTEAIRQQAISYGEISASAKEAASGGGMFIRQQYDTSQALMFSQSAAHGLMLGMGALNGSILQVAFSIIFLRFANVKLSLAVGASIVAVGGFVKVLKSMISASTQAANQTEELRRTLLALTGSIDGANAELIAIRRTALEFGVAQSEVIKGFEKLREQGVGTSAMLETVAIYARATGKSFSSAASEIAQAIKGDINSLSILSDQTKRSMERTWEFRDANARASWIIRQVNEDYKEFGKTARSTTKELKTTISEGFGLVFAVLGRGLNTIFRPLLAALATLARLWGSVMSQIERSTTASVSVTILVFGLLGVAIWKTVIVLKRLWVSILSNIKEFPVFISKITQAAASLVTELAPALNISATSAERLANSLRAVGAAAPAATAGAASAGAAAAGLGLGTSAAAGAMGRLGGVLGNVAKLLGPIAFIMTGLISVIEGVIDRTDTLNSVFRILGGIGSIVAGVLVAIGTWGIGTGAAVAMISSGFALLAPIIHDATKSTDQATESFNKLGDSINSVGDAIGHSPGTAQDIVRLSAGLSVAKIQTVEWKEKLKGLSSQIRKTGQEVAGLRLAGVPFDFGLTMPGVWDLFKFWLFSLFGGPGKFIEFFKEVDALGDVSGNYEFNLKMPGLWDILKMWLWNLFGAPSRFLSFFEDIKELGDVTGNFEFNLKMPSIWEILKTWLWNLFGTPRNFIEFFSSIKELGDVIQSYEFHLAMPGIWDSLKMWLWSLFGQPDRFLQFFRGLKDLGNLSRKFEFDLRMPGAWDMFKSIVFFNFGRWESFLTFWQRVKDMGNIRVTWSLKLNLPSVSETVGEIFGFQKGGIVTRPVIARVGEVPEAIIPLSKLRGGGLGGITVNISGNYILDDRTSRKLADRVSAEIVKVMGRYKSIPVGGIT